MSNFQPTIGLEIHVELRTKTKMFCDSLNDPDEKHPNVNVCPICMGHPGVLPAPNKKAIEYVILAGRAFNCGIAEYSQFDRKNYFYPDLPKGYQISQFYYPLCANGFLVIDDKKIRVKEIHLEEETGRLYHPEGADYSLVDFNRAGIPLMELVTQPDISSGAEAKKFCEESQLIFRYLIISDADMEKGQMRCEVNVSLAKHLPRKIQSPKSKAQNLGTKVEIKNLNSFKAVERAIDYEVKRQSGILKNNGKVVQETRGWNENKGETFSQRTKETAKDYRYFPEPDIPPLQIRNFSPAKIFAQNLGGQEFEIRNLPELPQQRRERFKKEYGLPEKDIEILVVSKELGEYFEKALSELKEWDKATHKVKLENIAEHFTRLTKLTANYLITELPRLIREFRAVDIKNTRISPENFAELMVLIHKGGVSSSGAQIVLREMFINGGDPSQIIGEKGIGQISGMDELEKAARLIIQSDSQAVADYRGGKEKSLQFLIGKMMRETRGKANPQIAKEILIKLLKQI